ncbi:MAG: hypothetical protein LQ340_003149 [Diploschistes diacapsis]|nr:MAG: hypothetical protein LQ340_003149 [Diploschistes diacapsis]
MVTKHIALHYLLAAAACHLDNPLRDDARVIQSVVAGLISQGRNVIVAMRSYGDTPALKLSQARQAKGLPGGVIHRVYLRAFVIPWGASLEGALGGKPEPFVSVLTVLVL